jgi:hypothetical protein
VADPKADALLKAARSGTVAKIRDLLEAGAPLEARDVNRMTPLLLAAQGLHVEAVRLLVDAGADLHAVAFRQLDLLEVATRSGNVEIVRFLLERGLPVNGHWKPLNETLRRMGHDTPLIQAADHGHVELVRILLEAGADQSAKYEGKTALERVKERLRDPDYAEQKQQYREIAALLGEAPVERSRSAESELREVEQFAENARRPAYVQLCERLVERCGAGRPWAPLPDHGLPTAGVVAFTLAGCKRPTRVKDLQQEARKAGCHLVLAEPWAPGQDAALVLFPTDNKLAVVAAVGTEGANYGVQTPNVVAWLDILDRESPFQLVFCNHESVGGSFLAPVKGAKELAERMIEFCPSILDEGPEDAEQLAREIKKRRSFVLRWD